jgi:hypothetical protein
LVARSGGVTWAMAAVEPLGSADPLDSAQWLVVSGTLREGDLASLLEGTAEVPGGNVTLDLCSLQVLTSGGCWAIRNLADELWARGRRLAVVFPEGGHVGDVLRASGTIDHPHIAFQVSIVD